MDFDEYEYLEKMVENPEPQKSTNGVDEVAKSEEKDRRRSSRHRGEDDDDLDGKSKRSRSGDEARDLDRHKEKSSSRHRSRSRERERSGKDGERHRSSREHRDREREERNGRDRDRDRDRNGEKGSERDSEKKERHREKDSERDKDRDKDERDRRSRSHSERHRDDVEKRRDREHREKSRDREYGEKSRDREHREKSRDRERSREREFREKSRDRDPRERDSRRHKEKKDEEPEADPERDQRTVFAYQLPLRADERDIFEFFSRVGKVRDVRLIMDRNSRRSKGVGYVEFYDVMSVPMAIALSGQLIRGQPVMVKPSEAEKNLVQSTSTAAGGALSGSGAARRLYVGNLVPHITEEQLRGVFENFGVIELVQLPRDETGLCKGFAFVQFARLEDAKAAQTINGQLDIGGRYIKVSAVTDQPGMQDTGATTGDLDDDEGGGLALNASSRALLMQKLDRSGSGTGATGSLATQAVTSGGISAPLLGAAPVVSPMVAPFMGGLPNSGLPIPPITLPTVDTIGVPSECLLLTNMFDPKIETEPDFDLDIKEDVQDECAKFGSLKHIFVDKNSEGHVYLKFNNTQAAMEAQRALHGRWFAGKMISATFMIPQNYEVKFPESR